MRKPDDSDWDLWLSETLLADKLIREALREVAKVTRGVDIFTGEQTALAEHGLFGALVAFTSGLERLCKVTLLADSLVTTGGLTNVRSHGHQLKGLLTALGVTAQKLPEPKVSEDLMDLLTDFANSQRYELLDALQPRNNPIVPGIFRRWWGITDRYPVSPAARGAAETMHLAHHALWSYLNSTDDWPEEIIWPLSEALDYPYDPASIQVAWHLYTLTSLIVEKLNSASHTLFYVQRIAGFPYLPEALGRLGSSDGELPGWALFLHEDIGSIQEEAEDFLRRAQN